MTEISQTDCPMIMHIVYRFDTGGLENGVVNLINHLPVGKFRHLVVADALGFIKARQVGQHEADGVAQPAIGFDIGLDDVLADAKVFGEVRCRGP